MSYDLMVFEPTKAPKDKREFLDWYTEQTKWEEDHSYSDPAVTSESLRLWLLEMVESFPSMNGPLASVDEADDEYLTDYSIGKSIIYAAFAWSTADHAQEKVIELADKFKLGFFDVSGSPDVFFPE